MASFLASFARAIAPPTTKAAPPVPVYEGSRGGWYPLIREAATGNWQRNITVDRGTALTHPTLFATITRIANDFAKMPAMVEREDENGVWHSLPRSANRILTKPNNFQTGAQFREAWMLSKLFRGNAYGLIERDRNGIKAIYVLSPDRVKPMVADDGSVFYSLSADNLCSGELLEDTIVPASEIIHDRMNCMFHPLIGVSPIYAAGTAAQQGINIINSSTQFFGNRSQPSGLLVAPGAISNETAARLKDQWNDTYSGTGFGGIGIVGDGLKFESLTMSAEDAELIAQLKWTSEAICAAFQMPSYLIGVGQLPPQQTLDVALNLYWSGCLQPLVQSFEDTMTVGLGLPPDQHVQMDESALLRMDRKAQFETLSAGIGGGFLTPNEARREVGLPPLEGGDSVFLQQQNYSLQALSRRDAGPDPFGTGQTAKAAAWDHDRTYTPGETVMHKGIMYEAQITVRGEPSMDAPLMWKVR